MKILVIGAIWCPACLIMNPRWNKLAKEYELDITHYDYDIDTDIVQEYNIGTILPVSIFLDDDNKEITRLVGEISLTKLTEAIDEYRKCR